MELTYDGSQVLTALGVISICLVVGIYITRQILHKDRAYRDQGIVSKKYPYLDILKHRLRSVGVGGVLSLAAAVILMSWTSYEPQAIYVVQNWEDDETEVIPSITPPEPKALPPTPPPAVEIEVVDDTILEEPDFVPLEVDDDYVYEPIPDMPDAEPAPAVKPPELPEIVDDIEEIRDFSEHMPLFGGCEEKACSDQKLIKYLSSNVKYPTVAKENGIEGRVYVQFVVEKDGSVANVQIMRSVAGGCDKEVLRVVNKMNTLSESWTPGRHHGKTVRVKYTLPVSFTLQ